MKSLCVHNNVRLARVGQGLTQQQLADLAGVTRQTIGLIESGDYNPTIRLCLAIAQITGKSLDELFRVAGEEED